MPEIRIKLAEVPICVRCAWPETVAFLRPFETAEEERFTVAPVEEDLLRMKEELIQTAEKEGHAPTLWQDALLERYAVHALLAEKLAACDVLLMHGSALCLDGEAYIFTAKSGTGKSTHARLWREQFGDRVWMINDDKPLLRISPEGVTVWGTPWNGKHHLGSNAGAPLKAIAEIIRSEKNRLEPMTKADAFPLLMKQVYASADPALETKILQLIRMLLDNVDFYSLHCNMEPEAASVAWEGMRKETAYE